MIEYPMIVFVMTIIVLSTFALLSAWNRKEK